MYKKDPLSLGNQTPIEAVIQHYVIDVFMRKKYHEISPLMIYNVINSFEKHDQTEDFIQEADNIKSITKKVIEDILQHSNDPIEWNIEHLIFLQGNTFDIDIYNKDIPIIGFSNTTVYHLMFKTDISDLNYWDIMIELLCERFLIFNPKYTIKGKNKEKFGDKPIQSYVFILKQNKCIKVEWDWDIKCNIEIKKLFKEAIMKHFSHTNKQLFKYCASVRERYGKVTQKTPF